MKVTHDDDKLPKPDTAAEAPPSASVQNFLDILEDAERRAEEYVEDGTAPYHIMQSISGQISRAQSGQGPFSARFRDIAVLSLAALLYTTRS